MGCDEYAALVDGPVCCPPQVVDGAKDLVGITGLHPCGSLMINQPTVDINHAPCLGREVLVDQPVPKQKYCLERGTMSFGLDTTKEGAAIRMPLTNTQVSDATCETIEDKYAVNASMTSEHDGLKGESLSSYLPKENEVSDVECELYLNEDIACETESEVSDSKNALSSENNLNTFSVDQQMSLKDGGLLVQGDLNPIPSYSNIQFHAENNVEVGGVCSNTLHGLHECSPLSPRFQLLGGSTSSGNMRNAKSVHPDLGGGHNIAGGEHRYPILEEQNHVATNTAFSSAVISEVERAGALNPECVVGCSAEVAVSAHSSLHTRKVDCEFPKNPVAQGPLRRSSREKKSNVQESRKRNDRKGSKASAMVVSDKSFNFLAAAVRRKRSCLNRDARASSWGSFHCLQKHIVEKDGLVIRRPGSAKSGGRTKKNNAQTSVSSLGSRGNVSSGPIRIRVKLGNEEIKTIKLVNCPLKTESIPSFSARNGDNHLKDLEKSITCQENGKDNLPHTEEGLEPGTSSGNDSGIPADNEKPRYSADDRYSNPGTSPDSEVINEVSNSQFVSRGVNVCQNGTSDLSKGTNTIGLDDTASPVASKVRRRKGTKKDKTPQQGSINALDKAVLSLNVEGEGGKGSNASAVTMNAGPESVDSLQSNKSLISAEVQEVQEAKKVKGSKYKGRKNSKPSVTGTTKSDVSRKVKGDKWALTDKHPIIDNNHPDQYHLTVLHIGNHYGTDTSCGRTSKGVYGIPCASGGVGESTARPHVAWVCCDDCHKWRCIPAILAEVIGDTSCTWTCKDNQDKAFADCAIPQEKSNEEINAELEISDGEDGHGNRKGRNRNGLEDESAVPQLASWKPIKSNIFLHRNRKKQTADEIMVCHCQSPPDGKFGCGDECLNRMVNIECVEGNCPSGDLCSNQQFQKRKYAKLDMFRCGKKGYGLQAQEDICEGKFLIEYVGEVLDLQSYEARQREYASKGHKHFYFMTLNGSEVIDACAKGNLGRFINHSCEPNCRTEKWIVNGEICIGLFATRDIKKGEEVTFDYNWVRVFGAAAKKCYCGSAQCRGYIGGDPHNTDVIIQGDSDEEFPEPVVKYEEKEIHGSGEGISTVCGSLGVAPGESKDIEQQHSTCSSLNLEDKGSKAEDLATAGSGDYLNISEEPAIGKMFDCAPENSEALPLEVVSSVSAEKSDISAVDKMVLDSSVVSGDQEVQESQSDIAKGENSRPRMKISRLSKPVKSKKYSSRVVPDALSICKQPQFIDNKPKKSLDGSENHNLETVDAKLGELLDSAGGICRRKDASRGYLKLLVLTSASGEGSDVATIQSTRDLSMILDAILKTKSRTVLVDIINKNGLQMLHLMMKKCRGNYNKIPILRKLLKVFEFLAEKEILTTERINGDPSRPGVESFRESILSLTEHQDKKVHQTARNFRDKWIQRQYRKYSRMDLEDRDGECNRGPNSSRSLKCWRERIENTLVEQDQRRKSVETMDSMGGSLPLRTSVDKELVGCSTQPTSSGTGKIRKRKSRWDQPAEDFVQTHLSKRVRNEENENMICDDKDDAPPGFSCPAFGAPTTSSNVISVCQRYPGPLNCPSEAPLALPSERYNSKFPVSYGIPLNIVQEFGTPQSATSDRWVIAPGTVFHYFPPLPAHPRRLGGNLRTPLYRDDNGGTMSTNGSSVTYQRDNCLPTPVGLNVDQGWASTSSVPPEGISNPNPNPDHNDLAHHERAPYSQGRRNAYSHQIIPKPPC